MLPSVKSVVHILLVQCKLQPLIVHIVWFSSDDMAILFIVSSLHLARTKQATNSIELRPQLVIKLPPFYGIQRFITCSQEPITCPYPEPSNFNLLIPVFKIHFNIILPSVRRSSKLYLFFLCPNQIPVYFSSPKHLPHAQLLWIIYL